jgi:hypothetical protein
MRNAGLYEQDFYRLTQEQVALVRERKWHEPDREHLMEEIEDLGRSARKELRSYLEGLVLHLLQWCYQPDYRTRSWRDSIAENRARIPDCLTESPSLRPQLPTLLQECYPHALAQSCPADTLAPAHLPRDMSLDGGTGSRCRLLAIDLVRCAGVSKPPGFPLARE